MERVHKLGACTWMFGDMPLKDIAQRLHKLGFDGVELVGDFGLYEPDEAAGILSDYGLAVFSLTPENVDLAHPDPTIRTEAVDYYLRLVDFAAALGGNPIVSCHGRVGRVRAISTQEEERAVFVEAVAADSWSG